MRCVRRATFVPVPSSTIRAIDASRQHSMKRLLDSLVRPVVRTLNVIDAVRRGRIESRMFKHLGIEVKDRRGGG